jgi:hypothetical protein
MFIVFLRTLLVEEEIFLIPKIDAPKTILASDAIFGEENVGAIFKISREHALVAILAIQHFVAQFAYLKIRAIHAIHAQL